MNVGTARVLNVALKLISSSQLSYPVSNLSLRMKTVWNSAKSLHQGTHLQSSSHLCSMWNRRIGAKSAPCLAGVYGCTHQQKSYSANSAPKESKGKLQAKQDQVNSAGGEVEEMTGLDKDAALGESRNRTTMDKYVRRATKATEKMKEKVADTVKDMNENIFTIPNLLSTSRLVMSPVLGYLVIQECYSIGTCLFVIAGITDLLDGFIARNFKNQQSVLGSIIDPLADKCLVAILTLSLTVSGLIPVPLTILMVSRDVGLVGSVFYLRYQSLPPPRTLARFFDVTHATVQLKPTTISKLNTAVQLGLVGFTLAAPVFNYVDHPLLHSLWYVTAATTILSGLSYIFSKDAFKFLRK